MLSEQIKLCFENTTVLFNLKTNVLNKKLDEKCKKKTYLTCETSVVIQGTTKAVETA